MGFFKVYLPISSFIIGTTALLFQINVLYPWHMKLDEEFHEIKRLKLETDKIYKEYNESSAELIKGLEDKVNLLIESSKI